MTTMGPRPYETTNPTRLPANSKKFSKSNYKTPEFSCASRSGHFPTKCTISLALQKKFESSTSLKLQPNGEAHLDTRRRNYPGEAEHNHNYSYNSCKYVKKGSLNSSSSFERNARNSQLSTASESESSASNSSNSGSELSGFKIVQEGKIVHNEVEEEPDSPRIGSKLHEAGNFWHFASSVMVTGPNVKEISVPSFA